MWPLVIAGRPPVGVGTHVQDHAQLQQEFDDSKCFVKDHSTSTSQPAWCLHRLQRIQVLASQHIARGMMPFECTMCKACAMMNAQAPQLLSSWHRGSPIGMGTALTDVHGTSGIKTCKLDQIIRHVHAARGPMTYWTIGSSLHGSHAPERAGSHSL